MALLNAQQVKEYRECLAGVIAVMEKKRATGNVQTPASYFDLVKQIEGLAELATESVTEKDWFDKYLLLYEGYFFKPEISGFTDIVRTAYQQPWSGLKKEDKIVNGQMNTTHYWLMNIHAWNADSFERNVIKNYQQHFAMVKLAEGLQPGMRKHNEVNPGRTVFSFDFTDADRNKFFIDTWCLADFMHLSIKNENFEQAAAWNYLQILFNLALK